MLSLTDFFFPFSYNVFKGFFLKGQLNLVFGGKGPELHAIVTIARLRVFNMYELV